MSVQAYINELEQKQQEINGKLENLKFLEENQFTSVAHLSDQLESKLDHLNQEIEAVIHRQIEKNPKGMEDERERQIWFASTLSKLELIYKRVAEVVSEVQKM